MVKMVGLDVVEINRLEILDGTYLGRFGTSPYLEFGCHGPR